MKNSLLLKVLLKGFCRISKQHSLLSFRTFGGIFLKVLTLLGLSNLNSFFYVGQRCFIKRECAWFLNLSIALLTESVMSLLLSTMYVFSVIPKLFPVFLKKLFISSATTLSLDSMSSFSLTSVILLTIFHFSEKKGKKKAHKMRRHNGE